MPHPWTPTKRAESLTAAPPENCHELVAHGVGMRRATFPMSQIFTIPMVMLEGPLMGLEQNYSIRMLSSLYTLLNSRYSDYYCCIAYLIKYIPFLSDLLVLFT